MNYGAEKGDATIWYRNLEWRLSCNRETSRNPPLYRAAFFLEGGSSKSVEDLRSTGWTKSKRCSHSIFVCIWGYYARASSLSLALAGTDFHLIKSIWTETTCADNSPFDVTTTALVIFVDGISTTIFFFFLFRIVREAAILWTPW